LVSGLFSVAGERIVGGVPYPMAFVSAVSAMQDVSRSFGTEKKAVAAAA